VVRPSPGPDRRPLFLAGGGLALAAAGAVIVWSVKGDYDRLHDSCGQTQTCSPSSYADYRTRADIGWSVVAVGGAAAAAGALWWMLTPRRAERSARLSP